MHVISLHPIDPETVDRFVTSLDRNGNGQPAVANLGAEASRARTGDERAAMRLTYGLAQALAGAAPVFTCPDAFGFTFWEAQVDRPLGMLMRPPARLFIEAGLDAAAARAMPTRLDFQIGMTGGAYIPARLIEEAHRVLDERLERSVRRLVAAEYDPMASFGLMYEAVGWARERGMGLYEALDVTGPNGEGLPGATVVRPDRKRLDREFAGRIEAAMKPEKRPGMFHRLLGRGGSPASVNGHLPEHES